MTEKTARLGTTTLHIQHDHELEPDMLRIQLENKHGTESWNQTAQHISSALERDDAPVDDGELSLADGSGHEFRARLLTEVEPMEDRQNDGHLMLSFHDDGDWQGACALRPDQVLELMALCVRALGQLAPEDPVIGSSRSEQEENHFD